MLKEKLQEVKDQNTNLYEHLNNVLTKMLLDNPKNAFELFEDYSFKVKSNGFKKNMMNLIMQKDQKQIWIKVFNKRH